jgi:hypothetical protein
VVKKRSRRSSRRKPNLKNRIASELETRVVAIAIEQPAWGQLRVANELAKDGLRISAAGVRGVWFRHDLHTMKKRLAALEALSAREGRVLTEAQVAALERVQREKETRVRIRKRVPRVLWGAGHVLRRGPEGGRAHLPANVHRHLQQSCVREAVHGENADHRCRAAQ